MRWIFAIILLSMLQVHMTAQQVFPVSDSAPALLNGLQAGYTITGESEKEVGSKGNFSRYKLRFYVTNTTTEAKLLFWLQRGDAMLHAGQAVPELVRFACQNATGARFTSKECSISASACNMEVLVEDKDASGKPVQSKRVANLGYWIRPGETISTNVIMIVPLNDRPLVTACFFPVTNSFAASLPNPAQAGYGPPVQTAYGSNLPATVRLMNMSSGTYLSDQNGLLGCVSNPQDGWGTQWELVPVAGASYFLIRNKMQNKFLTADNGGQLTDNGRGQAAWWSVERGYGSNGYSIRNAGNNALLAYQNGSVMVYGNGGMQDNGAVWMIERE